MRKKGRIKRNTLCGKMCVLKFNPNPKRKNERMGNRLQECCLGKENHRIPKVSEEVHWKKQREDLLTNR